MEFVNPGFLFGLFAIAVPVIIHLFNFRRFRKVYFTNVAFIRELKQETQKQSNLKHLLVLLSRILAVAAIVLAFARPYIPLEKNRLQTLEQNSVSIFIDNSFSMQAESPDGNLLQSAIARAREIASIYKPSDRFQLLTNDFEGRHLRFVSRDEFLDLLDEVDFSPVVRTYGEVRTRQADLQKTEPARVRSAYVLSDFQDQFLDSPELSNDSLLTTYFIPLQAVNMDNLYIDTCWFESPVQQVSQRTLLKLRIRNSSGNSYEDVPVKLKINGFQRALASFAIAPRGETEVELTYTTPDDGIQAGELEISDYPVSFDDRLYFSYSVSESVRILSINSEGPDFYLQSLFGNDSLVRFDNMPVNQLDFSALRDYRLIILNSLQTLSSGLTQELARFLESGGSLLVFPPKTFEDDSYKGFLGEAIGGTMSNIDTTNQRVGSVNLQHSLFSGVFDAVPENMDLPYVLKHFKISPSVKVKRDRLMSLQNGDDFLSQFMVGRGRLFLSAVPLDPSFSNFQQHAIFVPVLYKIAVSSGVPEELYYVLGENEVIRVETVRQSAEEVMGITDPSRSFEVIPEQRRVGQSEELYVYEQIPAAGNYYLTYAGTTIRGLSFNYDRRESEMKFHTTDDLKRFIADRQLAGVSVMETSGKPLAQSLADMSRGIQLWKWFVLAALVFLLAEVILLRFLP